MELDKSMLYVETAEGKDIELLYQLCKKQSYEEFCLWGADFVYDYPPNLAQMKQSYASRKRMLLYRVIFQERIIGFAELDFCILQMVRVSLVVYQNNTRAIRCYEACGFRMEEALIRKGRPDAWIMRALPAEKK
ncbi:MAG: hypothetical protein KHY39_04205 [Clostridiaceae bacterium]|nr:hypothetical protein [Clostridiaceae bacterium]